MKVEAQEGGGELLLNADFSPWSPEPSVAIRDGERELCVCTVLHAWIFLRFFDIDTGRVSRSVQVTCDETMLVPSVGLHANGVTVVGASGLLDLALPGFEIARRFERNWSRDRGLCFVDGILPIGSRLLWGRYDDDGIASGGGRGGRARGQGLPRRRDARIRRGREGAAVLRRPGQGRRERRRAARDRLP